LNNQRLEQEKEDLEKEFKNHLSEQEQENVRLKNLNQGLLEQLKKLKEEKLKNPDIKDIDKPDSEKKPRLKTIIKTYLHKLKSLRIIRNLWKTS
jgi:hypothetical protein